MKLKIEDVIRYNGITVKCTAEPCKFHKTGDLEVSTYDYTPIGGKTVRSARFHHIKMDLPGIPNFHNRFDFFVGDEKVGFAAISRNTDPLGTVKIRIASEIIKVEPDDDLPLSIPENLAKRFRE